MGVGGCWMIDAQGMYIVCWVRGLTAWELGLGVNKGVKEPDK